MELPQPCSSNPNLCLRYHDVCIERNCGKRGNYGNWVKKGRLWVLSSCSWEIKLLVAADPWVPSEKTGCPGIVIPPGTQVLKVPQGLLVSHTSQYLPRITMLWTVKDGDAGELSSEVTLTLLSGSLDSRRGKSVILNFKSFLRSSSSFTSSSAEWDILPTQFPGHSILSVCSLASSPGEWVQHGILAHGHRSCCFCWSPYWHVLGYLT